MDEYYLLYIGNSDYISYIETNLHYGLDNISNSRRVTTNTLRRFLAIL